MLLWFCVLRPNALLTSLRAHQLQHEIRNLGYRGRIISPGESDGAQIRTPKVASFLRDVALRDLAVHAAHAACVDGRGDVYQWGDGFFAQESAPGDRKPVLTLRGKVRLIPVSLRSQMSLTCHVWRVGH